MKDLQGKWRDKCSKKGCLCKEYRVEDEKNIRCDYCNHTPAEHCWRGRCKNPECEKEYEQAGGGCQEYEEDEDEVESCGYCSHKKEEHTLMKSPCQPSAPMAGHVGSTPAASGPKCKVPGCTKPCFMEPNGHVHDYCSRRHAQAAASSVQLPVFTKASTSTSSQNSTPIPSEHFRPPSEMVSAPGNEHSMIAPKTKQKVCKRPGCNRPCFVEPSGHVYDYCGRKCSSAK